MYQSGASAFIIDYIVPRGALFLTLALSGKGGGGVSVTGWGSPHLADFN